MWHPGEDPTHELCDDIGRPCFVKTTGVIRAAHVLLPLGRQCLTSTADDRPPDLQGWLSPSTSDIATLTRSAVQAIRQVYLDGVQKPGPSGCCSVQFRGPLLGCLPVVPGLPLIRFSGRYGSVLKLSLGNSPLPIRFLPPYKLPAHPIAESREPGAGLAWRRPPTRPAVG